MKTALKSCGWPCGLPMIPKWFPMIVDDLRGSRGTSRMVRQPFWSWFHCKWHIFVSFTMKSGSKWWSDSHFDPDFIVNDTFLCHLQWNQDQNGCRPRNALLIIGVYTEFLLLVKVPFLVCTFLIEFILISLQTCVVKKCQKSPNSTFLVIFQWNQDHLANNSNSSDRCTKGIGFLSVHRFYC